MCGRFTLTADIGELQGRFEFDGAGLTHAPSYNIAPTQPVLAVLNGNGRQAHLLRWGLVPSWAKSASPGRPMINARAETVAERARFSQCVQAQTLPRPRRRLLRVATRRLEQVAIQNNDILRGAVRLCRPVGNMAGPVGRVGQVLHHNHDDRQQPAQTHP